MRANQGILSAVAAVAVTLGGPSLASGMGYQLHATAPLVCFVHKIPASTLAEGGNILGRFQEYCNSPTGYEVRVSYEPGSMVGVELTAGEQRLVLDGSGSAVFERSNGARSRQILMSSPDEANGRQLTFDIVPL